LWKSLQQAHQTCTRIMVQDAFTCLSVHMDVHRLRTRFGSVSAVSVTRLTCTRSLVCFLLTHPLLYHMLWLCDSQPSTDSCITLLSMTPTCVVYSLALQASCNLRDSSSPLRCDSTATCPSYVENAKSLGTDRSELLFSDKTWDDSTQTI
jgi:hypothetical protein